MRKSYTLILHYFSDTLATNQALPQSEDSSEDDEDICYVEESSESEPELECDLWDVDCKVLGQVKCSRTIIGCKYLYCYI